MAKVVTLEEFQERVVRTRAKFPMCKSTIHKISLLFYEENQDEINRLYSGNITEEGPNKKSLYIHISK